MKNLLKPIVVAISWTLVRRLLKKNHITVVGVAGSLGKSGTKRAVATLLSQKYRVRWQDGNYNDLVSVPLVFFGLSMPSLFNPFAWLRCFIKMNQEVNNYAYEIVVLELGTDGPGQLDKFGKYLQLDIGIVTRIAPEHMEFFGDIEAVAKEELSIQAFSKSLIVHDDAAKEYKRLLTASFSTFGDAQNATAKFDYSPPKLGVSFDGQRVEAIVQLLGRQQMWGLAAAALAAYQLGVPKEQIQAGLKKITAMPGRMQKLEGIKDSTIIDDTYNANAEAMIAALDVLYDLDAPQKIAVLGNMNEMGKLSQSVHSSVGHYVDPKKVDLLITLGKDANRYLAEAAQQRGCKVMSCKTPYEVGDVLKKKLQNHGVVLLKGSQNGVFLEEAIKSILKNPEHTSKLVRQSPIWLARKAPLLRVL
jgi:UDP-N-acetylmuramyl pentapeptide synthase